MDMRPAQGEIADLIRSMMADDVRPSQPKPRASKDPWSDEEREAILTVPSHYSMTFPEQLTQALAWPAQDLPPLNRAANTTLGIGGWFVGPLNTTQFYRALAKVMTGAGTAGSTVVGAWFAGNTTNSLQAATGAAWTWAQVTTGATINIANSATATSCTCEIRTDQLPSNTQYIAFVINNQCAQLFAAEVIVAEGPHRPTSKNNNTAALGQSVT